MVKKNKCSSERGLEKIHSPVFDISIFEVKDGMVNLTKIGYHFKKDVNTWRRSKKVQEFIQKLDKISGLQNLQIRLGDGEQGTFATEKVAIKFAEYISTDFEVWANDKIHTLLNKGSVELQTNNALTINADFMEQVAKKMRQLEQEKQQIIEETKPAIQFVEKVNNSINSITIAEFAKILGTGQIRLFALLREEGYLMNGRLKNLPYQEFIDDGYFKVVERTYTNHLTGEECTYTKTLITGKGQIYLTKKLKEKI